MMTEPLVSIITPVYNSEKFLSESIESVLRQSYSNWEHLLVDDCSTDMSWNILTDFSERDNRIKVFRLVLNSGPGEARNYAIQKAIGKYVAFLDSDDIWLPDRLKKHVEFMMKGNYVFSHSSYGYLNENGTVLPKVYNVSDHEVDYKFLLKRTDISCLTAIYDQDSIGKFYMPTIRKKQDYGLWLSILKAGHNSIPFPEVLAYYRQRKGSVTNQKSKLIIHHYRFLRTNEHLSIIQSIWYTLLWILGGVSKYYLPGVMRFK